MNLTHRPIARCATRGFTLIEVLVAMTILAVGVSALVSASGASAFRAEYLREREFSRWIATNELTKLQVLPSWPKAGTTNTEVDMISTRWHVRTRTRNVSDKSLRRVDIEVRRDKQAEAFLYSVTGFIGDPAIRVFDPPVFGAAAGSAGIIGQGNGEAEDLGDGSSTEPQSGDLQQ